MARRMKYKTVSESYARNHFRGKLTYRERKELPKSDFAYDRSYPIYNRKHAINALARVKQYGTPEEQHKVCLAVHKKYPDIHEKHCDIHG